MMIVFAVSAVVLHPNWNQVARGLVPSIPAPDTKHLLLYGYFAVGIFSALLMEYEVHFFSSGAMEEDWTPKDHRGELYGSGVRVRFGPRTHGGSIVIGGAPLSAAPHPP